MRVGAALAAASIAAVPAFLGLGAEPASAQSPAGCSANSLALNLNRDRPIVRPGEVVTYTVAAANSEGAACDITNATVTLRLPAADGTPTGQSVTLATGVNFPAGTALRVLGTVPYTVAVNPGITEIVARAEAAGTLQDAPTPGTANIGKTLGTPVTQPRVTLAKTATPGSGQAPLPVTYGYTLRNESSTNVPVSGATVSDDLCPSVTRTGGDADNDNLLDVGEAWTFTCAQTLATAGVFTNTATAVGTSTVDNRPVPIAPAQAVVTVTAPPPPPVTTRPVAQGRALPPANSRQARGNARCVSVPQRLSVRAGEVTVVRVRVREGDTRVTGALVRISGPGFAKRARTNAGGSAVIRVRPKRSGTLVIQSDRCLGADRVEVRRARQVTSRRVPRVTG